MLTTLVAAGLITAFPVLHFEREKIADTIYEAASVFDVNKDGHKDIVTGEYWFEGPDFKRRHFITELMRVEDYYDNFSMTPMDVNGDGYLDIVAGGWFGRTFQWQENPKGATTEWTVHNVAEVGNIERNNFYDINGDGHLEVFTTTQPVNFFRLIRDEEGKGTGKFERYMINEGGGGHGFGMGDINGNGRPDMIFATGWYETPEDPFDVNAYIWHPEFDFGMASVPILVHDITGNGLNDLIVGQGHDYGLAWYEQGRDEEGKRTWTKHDIETDRSQFHEMQLADLDNDGQLELVTGKRWRAHLGKDPGADDPLGVYYYKINGGKFDRVTLDYGPADRASGTGIYMWIEDINGNGWKDIVAPGKEGLYVFWNKGLKKDE